MTTQELIAAMPVGKALHKTEAGAFRCVRRSPSGNGFHVLGSYLVPAQHDEDPESIMCGCPFQMRPHMHVEGDGLTAEAACAAYEQLKSHMDTMHLVSFARPTRKGA